MGDERKHAANVNRIKKLENKRSSIKYQHAYANKLNSPSDMVWETALSFDGVTLNIDLTIPLKDIFSIFIVI